LYVGSILSLGHSLYDGAIDLIEARRILIALVALPGCSLHIVTSLTQFLFLWPQLSAAYIPTTLLLTMTGRPAGLLLSWLFCGYENITRFRGCCKDLACGDIAQKPAPQASMRNLYLNRHFYPALTPVQNCEFLSHYDRPAPRFHFRGAPL